MKKRDGYSYRICKECGTEWNVSVHNKDRVYFCPRCRMKGGNKNGNTSDKGNKYERSLQNS